MSRPHRRAMKATTVRFGGLAYSMLQASASRENVSMAQYVREAAVMRLAWERAWEASAASQGEPHILTLAELQAVATEVLAEMENAPPPSPDEGQGDGA